MAVNNSTRTKVSPRKRKKQNQNKVKKAYLNIKDKLEVYTIKIEGTLEEVLSSYGVEICN